MTGDTDKNKPKWYQGGRWDELEQGDLLPACPIIATPDNLSEILNAAKSGNTIEIPTYIDYANLIVATQTCDLQNDGKTGSVVLCAYHDTSQFPKTYQTEVFKGKRVAQFMLDRCDLTGLRLSHQIIDFRSVYSLPLPFLKEFAASLGRRARLRSPYKEHFSRAFGNIFSRVALPRNLSNL